MDILKNKEKIKLLQKSNYTINYIRLCLPI